MYNERAEFDIFRSHVIGITPHRCHLYDRSQSVNYQQHFLCIFCQAPIESDQGVPSQTPTVNTMVTPIPPGTSFRPQQPAPSSAIMNKSSSSSVYPPLPDVVCKRFVKLFSKSFVF
jgi:hypothetical protein